MCLFVLLCNACACLYSMYVCLSACVRVCVVAVLPGGCAMCDATFKAAGGRKCVGSGGLGLCLYWIVPVQLGTSCGAAALAGRAPSHIHVRCMSQGSVTTSQHNVVWVRGPGGQTGSYAPLC